LSYCQQPGRRIRTGSRALLLQRSQPHLLDLETSVDLRLLASLRGRGYPFQCHGDLHSGQLTLSPLPGLSSAPCRFSLLQLNVPWCTRTQKRLIGGGSDLADRVMGQAFVIVSAKVRICLLNAIGDLPRCGNLGFLFCGIETELERVRRSFIRGTGRTLEAPPPPHGKSQERQPMVMLRLVFG